MTLLTAWLPEKINSQEKDYITLPELPMKQ